MASSDQKDDGGGLGDTVRSMASKLIHPSGEWREKFRHDHPMLHDVKAHLTNKKHALGKFANIIVSSHVAGKRNEQASKSPD